VAARGSGPHCAGVEPSRGPAIGGVMLKNADRPGTHCIGIG